jgi:hypothetical protein
VLWTQTDLFKSPEFSAVIVEEFGKTAKDLSTLKSGVVVTLGILKGVHSELTFSSLESLWFSELRHCAVLFVDADV